MYDLTPQQYDSLIKLTATLCTVLPKLTPDYPREDDRHTFDRGRGRRRVAYVGSELMDHGDPSHLSSNHALSRPRASTK